MTLACVRTPSTPVPTPVAASYPNSATADTLADRVVAVVGSRPILLSEVRARRSATQRCLSVEPRSSLQTLPQALDEMVDDELIRQQADQAHVAVPDDDIDRRARLLGFIADSECRDVLRRLQLDHLMFERRVGHLKVTETDARAAYALFLANVANEDKSVELDEAWFPLDQIAAAHQIVAQVRRGKPLCGLVSCSSHELQPSWNVVPEVRRVVATMQEGDVTDPITINGTVFVLRLRRRAIPTFDEAHDVMRDRAWIDAATHARGEWMKELRRSVGVELKL
jgi:hypothetical protein